MSRVISPEDRRFNPRAREGRDRFKLQLAEFMPGFNPRAREGRDRLYPFCCFLRLGFNPRAREGRDKIT